MTTFNSKSQAIRLEMHEWLSIEKDDDFVIEVAKFIRKKRLDSKFSIPLTEEMYVNRVLESAAQVEKGEGISVEELEKLAKTW